MKTVIRSNAFVHSIAIAVSLFAIGTVAAQSRKNIELNEIAFTFAMELIKERHVIADGKGAWTKHRPSADEENEFIRLHGFAQYAKWHLGIDRRFPENSKRRYKFPYGDFKNVHRCGLLAAKARARQYGYMNIKDAAAELTEMISSNSGVNAVLQKKSSFFLDLDGHPLGGATANRPVAMSDGMSRSSTVRPTLRPAKR
jgi:hypothetical protein